MVLHRVFICLGTNEPTPQRLGLAHNLLLHLYQDVAMGRIMTTEAIGEQMRSPFFNQVGTFTTPLPLSVLQCELKEMEIRLGRNPTTAPSGIVPIDIDLLTYDAQVLKPDDLKRTYVRHGLLALIKQITHEEKLD